MAIPKVSILVPCYNSARFLGQTLDSALSQIWKNIEIILVDDGSTDESLSVAKKYESGKVIVLSQKKAGAASARNLALSKAQGEYIQYLDADDILARDKIEQQMRLFSNAYRANFVVSSKWARFYHSVDEAQFKPEPVWADYSPVDWYVTAWTQGGMMNPAAWLTPRKLVDEAGAWDTSLSVNDDGEYFCRIVLASQGVKFCPLAEVYYRSGLANSLSGQKSSQAINSYYKSLNLCIAHLLAKENSQRTIRASAIVLQRFVNTTYPYEPALISDAEKKIKAFGGSSLRPSGGKVFKLAASIVGWKLARKLQLTAQNLV